MNAINHHLLSRCIFLSHEKQRAAEQIRDLENYSFLIRYPDRSSE